MTTDIYPHNPFTCPCKACFAVRQRAERATHLAKRRAESVGALMDDAERAAREHEPDKRFVRCGCGSIAFAIAENKALGTREVTCLVCGAIPAGALHFTEGR